MTPDQIRRWREVDAQMCRQVRDRNLVATAHPWVEVAALEENIEILLERIEHVYAGSDGALRGTQWAFDARALADDLRNYQKAKNGGRNGK